MYAESGMIRKTAKRHAVFFAFIAGGESDFQNRRGDYRVFKKHLIKSPMR